jgi:hypothetical protein
MAAEFSDTKTITAVPTQQFEVLSKHSSNSGGKAAMVSDPAFQCPNRLLQFPDCTDIANQL